MFRLRTQTPETATGSVAEMFQRFPAQVGVPKPMLLLSASTGLLEAQAEIFRYYRGHARLGFEFLAAIRFLASRVLRAPDCLDFNHRLLEKAGLTSAEIDALPESGGDFNQAERALLAHCVRLVSDPGVVADAGIEALRGHGWTDADILDASMQAANMQVPALLMQAFKR